MYRVSKDGKTFRNNRPGIAVYLFRSMVAPEESRAATDQEVEDYDAAHKAIWKRVAANMGLGRKMAEKFDIHDEHIVTNIAIDTLLRCVEGYDASLAAFSTYASRSLYRAFQRYRKHERKFEHLLDDTLGGMFSIEHEDKDMVQFIMNGLDEYDKRILLLRYWQGLSMQQLADVLGVVKSTVWADIRRILTLCRRIAKCEDF